MPLRTLIFHSHVGLAHIHLASLITRCVHANANFDTSTIQPYLGQAHVSLSACVSQLWCPSPGSCSYARLPSWAAHTLCTLMKCCTYIMPILSPDSRKQAPLPLQVTGMHRPVQVQTVAAPKSPDQARA